MSEPTLGLNFDLPLEVLGGGKVAAGEIWKIWNSPEADEQANEAVAALSALMDVKDAREIVDAIRVRMSTVLLDLGGEVDQLTVLGIQSLVSLWASNNLRARERSIEYMNEHPEAKARFMNEMARGGYQPPPLRDTSPSKPYRVVRTRRRQG